MKYFSYSLFLYQIDKLPTFFKVRKYQCFYIQDDVSFEPMLDTFHFTSPCHCLGNIWKKISEISFLCKGKFIIFGILSLEKYFTNTLSNVWNLFGLSITIYLLWRFYIYGKNLHKSSTWLVPMQVSFCFKVSIW